MLYEFSQNNSYGIFVENERLCSRVIIEADNAEEANEIAEELGIYYNGVADGFDCPCCGDRWYRADETDRVESDITLIETYLEDSLKWRCHWTTPDIRVFFKNGTIKEYTVE